MRITTIMANNNIIANNVFDCVCDDLMIEMMSYITVNEALNLLRVSNRSQSLISVRLRNMSVMNRYTIIGTNTRRMTTSNICAILTNWPNVKHIDFRNIELIDEEEIEDSSDDNSIVLSIANGCPNVESIHFDALEVNHNFELLAKNCTKLKSISSKTINDESLKHLLNKDIASQTLESLDVSQNANITGNEFKIIGPKMKEINLNNSLIDVNTAIQRLSFSYGSKIEKLSVYVNNLSVMKTISNEFANLTHLRLYVSYRPFDFLGYVTTRNFPRLTTLSISFDLIKFIVMSQIMSLELTASLVVERNVNRLTLTDLFKINLIFPRLRKLRLPPIDVIDDRLLLCIIDPRIMFDPRISRPILTRLEHLDLMGCEKITDRGAQQLIYHFHYLRHLNLHNCPLIALRTLSAFIICRKQLTLDVINTSITRSDVPNVLSPNLHILVNTSDCLYGCPH